MSRPYVVDATDDDDYTSFSQLTTATTTRGPVGANGEEGPMMIRVIAPASLREGYTFDVLVDDEPYTVKVPRGGVKEGQEFEVEYNPYEEYKYKYNKNMEQVREEEEEDGEYDVYEDNDLDDNEDGEDLKQVHTYPRTDTSDSQDEAADTNDTKHQQSKKSDVTDGDDASDKIWYDDNGAPIGQWRTTLCSCCDVLTQSTFWMGLCCTPILMAQLITRLGLTWNGRTGPSEETSLSYNRIVLGLIITLVFWKVPFLGGVLLLGFYLVVVVYIGSQVRAYMRQKYKVPNTLPTRCGQRVDDVCLMLLCGCCSSIQMARHTHDDKEYPGHGCTTTGLGLDAPSIV
jgi:Cys-rich protein (TIGR01571 family)